MKKVILSLLAFPFVAILLLASLFVVALRGRVWVNIVEGYAAVRERQESGDSTYEK